STRSRQQSRRLLGTTPPRRTRPLPRPPRRVQRGPRIPRRFRPRTITHRQPSPHRGHRGSPELPAGGLTGCPSVSRRTRRGPPGSPRRGRRRPCRGGRGLAR
ncbi:unnamed protein product, partial [Ectocarpus sp. 12 AP-2014]